MISSFSCEEITKESFSNKISGENAIIKFHASWCTSCDELHKNFEDVNDEVNFKKMGIVIFNVNIEKQRELAQMYNIRSLPSIIYLKNGQLVGTEVGLRTPSEIKESLAQKFK